MMGASPQPLQPLTPERLAWRCDPDSLGFECTDEVLPLEGLAGQDRALGAIELGLELDAPGYNLYVVGPPGSGRTTTVRREAARIASQKPPPADWCSLHNFEIPHRPVSVRLPTGQGPQFAQDVEELIASLRRDIPKIFESEAYQQRRSEVLQAGAARHDATMAELSKLAGQLGVSLQAAPGQIMAVPVKSTGEPMTPGDVEPRMFSWPAMGPW